MGRAKPRMELISNKKTRNLTFKNRKKGMMKKAYELQTLCDVELSVITYGPMIDDHPVEAELWPPDREVLNRLISSYRSQPPEDRAKRTHDVSSFFQDRNQKMEDELVKLRKRNSEAKYASWDNRYDAYPKDTLMAFETMLENKIQNLKAKIETLKGSHYYPLSRSFYGPGNLEMGQAGPLVNLQMKPFPYAVDAGTSQFQNSQTMMMLMPEYQNRIGYSSHSGVGLPFNPIWRDQATAPEAMIEMGNTNLVSNIPLRMQRSYHPMNMEQKQTPSPYLPYHVEMANAAASHAYKVQMDYFRARASQTDNNF